MAVKAKKSGDSKSVYTVQGKTLQQIWDDIVAKGPKSNGKAVAGLTRCTLSGVSGVKFKFDVTENKGSYEAEAQLDSAEIGFSCSIQLPKLASTDGLSQEARKAWQAFLTGVAAHELEHVKEFEKECNLMAKEMGALTASGKDKSESGAKKAAQKAWEQAYKTEFAEAKNAKRLEANAKALDGKTGHGPTLDLSIP
jgi:predicted secreted Zn-dependent protease